MQYGRTGLPLEWPSGNEIVKATDRVAIAIPDHTRPLPRERLLPWLFAELAHVPAENFAVINGAGSHRANPPDELRQMVSTAIPRWRRSVPTARCCSPCCPRGR